MHYGISHYPVYHTVVHTRDVDIESVVVHGVYLLTPALTCDLFYRGLGSALLLVIILFTVEYLFVELS